jgi:quinol monooxygenase YgiN
MIHVIATITVQPGKRGALIEAFRALVPLVRREAGCIEYGPAVDFDAGIDRQPPPRENVLVVIEKWENVAALKAHLVIDHMQKFREQSGGLMQSVEVRTLHPEE